MRRPVAVLATWLVACAEPLAVAPVQDSGVDRLTVPPRTHDYALFEAGPVRPVALTPSRHRLIVTNIPDDRIEVFRVDAAGGLTHERSVAVGLRPVAVAARSDTEVWVVNHLSDSVSVVDLDAGVVVRTLLVGDEPRDVVFAGPGRRRAFVTTAHRGQHRTDPSLAGVPGAGSPQFVRAGVPRADVWVFDADAPGQAFGGRPLRIVQLFGDTPRGLAVSPDGGRVYAAIFHSGNRTTVVHEQRVCDGFGAAGPCAGDNRRSPNGLPRRRLPGGLPGPFTNHQGIRAPETSLIVQWDPQQQRWEDALGRNWSNGVRFHLPDLDLFAIDANTLAVLGSVSGLGTTLFNVATNPVTGRIYVSNTEAQNLVMFEGSGDFGGSTVQGDLARSRISVVDPVDRRVVVTDLNSHLDRRVRPAPPGAEDHSLATPLDLVVSDDGRTLYLAAFGSGLVAVLPTADIEAGAIDPTVRSAGYVPVTGGGPAGLALDDVRDRLYVYTRFDNGVSVIDTAAGTETDHFLLPNPEPPHVVAGRPLLYDARATSSNGEASCASCHIFADADQLAWNLGDPDADVTRRLGVIRAESRLGRNRFNGTGDLRDMHPMKGPMLTQTLRGIATHGAMHWRGDRMVGELGSDPTDERTSFLNFVVTFRDLLGDDVPVDDPQRRADIEALADFVLAILPPPNPVRALDRSFTPAQRRGAELYFQRRITGLPPQFDTPQEPAGQTCNGCHVLDPVAGFFGADGAAGALPCRRS